MPLSTYLGTTEATEYVPTERIGPIIAGFQYTATVGMGVAWPERAMGSVPHRFVRWNELTIASGTVAETVDAPDTNVDTTESSIAAASVRFRLPISDDLVMEQAQQGRIPMSALAEAMRALQNRIDSDILSASTSATQTNGSVTRTYTLTEFKDDIRAYDALDVPPGMSGTVAVISKAAGHQLTDSLTSAAATLIKSEGDTLQVSQRGGFMGTLHGISVYKSGNVPNESTGASGLMTEAGQNASGYGFTIARLPSVVPTRGDDAERRKVTYFVFDAFYGTGLTSPTRSLELLTQR